MRSRCFLLVLLVGGLGAATSCRSGVGTAIFLTIRFDSSFNITQLRFSGQSAGRTIFAPEIRPERPATNPLSSGQTIRILLPDAMSGQTATLGIEGLVQGQVVASAQVDAVVKKGSEVEIEVTLSQSGGPNCGACSGCCAGVTCVSPASFNGCGGNGTLCASCDPTLADACSSLGDCQCGSTRACAPERGSDRCVAGRCMCGSSVCAPGEKCVNGQCLCTPASCPTGCCSGSSCLPGSSDNSCGAGGFQCEQCPAGQQCVAGVCSDCPASCSTGCCSGETCHARQVPSCGVNGTACIACDPVRSDSCSGGGSCLCGSGPQCGPGLHCDQGACHCDAVSCPNGCCLNDVCQTSIFLTCGKGGRQCSTCTSVVADNCSPLGECSCGNGAQCGDGQKCVNGSCTCNPATCIGCCAGDQCIRNTNVMQCGVAGLPCSACDAGVDCVSGVCSDCSVNCVGGCCSGPTCWAPAADRCGNDGGGCFTCSTARSDQCLGGNQCGCEGGAPCPLGQECRTGEGCRCTGNSCPDGCCDLNVCRVRSTAFCGISGNSCRPCDSRLADNCTSDGRCQCGSAVDGGVCNNGQECLNGQCVCTSASCPTGCCFNQQCVSPSVTTCGIDGGLCFACDPVRANVCSNGHCQCGTQPTPCPMGRRCDAGVCQ